MKIPNDGGPITSALILGNDGSAVAVGGLSLRDWFAGMALQGATLFVNQHEDCYSEYVAEIARESYLIADAMLVARNKPEP